ncbi:MAG TPA: NADH-quinone oxidoreductase subunit J [Terracidiphilus sp.]|nr:NADH-quinone oxidoreductase subunit J [Terracidiphilus sp.]
MSILIRDFSQPYLIGFQRQDGNFGRAFRAGIEQSLIVFKQTRLSQLQAIDFIGKLTMHLILFLLFAGFCLAGAINLLLQSHPINSALSLIVVMTSLAVLYLLLGAEFLAAAQVIVYSGAIMVLFTFVVMLLNAGREERTLGSRAARAIGFPAVVVVLGVLATVILRAQGLGVAGLNDGITSTEDLSRVLFHELLLPFEVTSVLILIAILGAVALARQGHGDSYEHEERPAGR